jgi:hypothetical protein
MNSKCAIAPGASVVRQLLPLVASAMIGCSNAPEVGTVEGVVRLDGKPVAGGLVVFEPENDEGKFRLISNDGRPGAIVGTHRVVVRGASKFAVVTDKESDEVTPAADPAADLIPRRYSQVDRTPLRQEVTSGSNAVTIEIASEPGTQRDAAESLPAENLAP